MATHAKRDYYEILSVERTAVEQDIKSSYRNLAKQYHPDHNPGNPEAEEKFKEASEAYSVLMDSEKRARYDRFGHAGVSNGGGGFDPSSTVDFSDIFGDLFSDLLGVNVGGRGGQRGSAQRGGDKQVDLYLTFEEAAFGKKTQVKVRRYEVCEHCKGSGAAPGKGPVTCSTCAGRGQVRYQQGGLFSVSVVRTCPTCHGSGRAITDPCTKCRGETRIMRERTAEITVPAGVEDTNNLRIPQFGDAGVGGGPSGNLYVAFHVKPHPFFEREGKDLFCSIPISFTQAALGAEITIPTLEGEHKLKVAEGTQAGTVLRVRGKGVASLNEGGAKGDLHVRLRVETPRKLSKRQRELLEELGTTFAVENKPEPRGLFEKVKDIFG